VVQRQLWLMHNTGMETSLAYDKARKEFYAIRQQEEADRRVAREEALWVGAYFGKGALEIGMELEDKTFESWKKWATQEIANIAMARDAAYTGLGTDDTQADSSVEALEDLSVGTSVEATDSGTKGGPA
jgi:small subunit ribosomal protein S23